MWVSLLRAGFCLLVPAAIAAPGLLMTSASRAAAPVAALASLSTPAPAGTPAPR